MSASRETVVVKFGGTSLGTPSRIRSAARRVAALVAGGRRVVAVVSAMGHTTDHILETLGALENGSRSNHRGGESRDHGDDEALGSGRRHTVGGAHGNTEITSGSRSPVNFTGEPVDGDHQIIGRIAQLLAENDGPDPVFPIGGSARRHGCTGS